MFLKRPLHFLTTKAMQKHVNEVKINQVERKQKDMCIYLLQKTIHFPFQNELKKPRTNMFSTWSKLIRKVKAATLDVENHKSFC